uniref:Calpain catalytic domain-containing protein n=1 Tax=Globodera pallida TaxID=36090 RepID=A0A183C6P6_GLOPA
MEAGLRGPSGDMDSELRGHPWTWNWTQRSHPLLDMVSGLRGPGARRDPPGSATSCSTVHCESAKDQPAVGLEPTPFPIRGMLSPLSYAGEDNAGVSSGQAVAKWLLTPRGDGLPKMFRCDELYSAKMDGLKTSFVNASESVNFIIRLRSFAGIVPYDLKNNWTGERLTLRQIDEDNWLLVRCPIGREEDKWTNWEKEAIEWKWSHQWNFISIDFKDSGIGDG